MGHLLHFVGLIAVEYEVNIDRCAVIGSYELKLALIPAFTDPAIVFRLEPLKFLAGPGVLLLNLMLSYDLLLETFAGDNGGFGLRQDSPLLDDWASAFHAMEEVLFL